MEMLTVYTLRLLAAAAVGGIVGLEREFKGKPAGLRTNILMCIGSCLFMIISIEVARAGGVNADAGRIAAQVVTGVGFLCAGTIMRSRFSVSGLTTAATIWVLAALGLAIGAGYLLLGAVGAVLITLTLVGVRFIEGRINMIHGNHIIQLTLESRQGIISDIVDEFSKMNIRAEIHQVNLSGDTWTASFEYDTTRKKNSVLRKALYAIEGVKSIHETA